MRESIKQFVNICAKSLPIIEPIYEFGSLQVPGQEGFADLRPIFPDMEYVGCDMREGVGVDRLLNLHHIDLPDESVGTVLCLDTLEHVEYPRRGMEEIRRILKSDGLVVISSVMNFPIHDYPNDYWRFTPEAFNSLLQYFNIYYSDFAGDEQFPHTVIGVAFKGDMPEEILENFQLEIKIWKELYRVEHEGPENQVSAANEDLPSSPFPVQHLEPLSSKRYEPASLINLEDKNDSHSLIVELAGTNNTILEVGTSTGYLTKILKVRGNRVIGIEFDKDAAEIAEKYCDLMIPGDVEEIDLEESLAPGSIDVAIFGDVLEHLKYPAAVLKKVRRYLKPRGSIIVSIPNVCHGDVLISLLKGDFRYTSMGLLDETHLRFFGLKNVLDLLAGSGYSVEEVRATRHPVGGTELRRSPDEVPREIRTFIEALPNSDVYQFVLAARPSDDPKSPPVPAADLKAIFDRSVEPLLRKHEEPLRREVAEVLTKNREALDRIRAISEEKEKAREEVRSLNQAVLERDGRIVELGEEVLRAEERIASLDQALSEREGKTEKLIEELQKSGSQVRYLENEIRETQRSIVWQLTMKYHNTFVERGLTQGTRRRNMYDLAIKGGRVLINDGWGGFWRSYNSYNKQKKIKKNSIVDSGAFSEKNSISEIILLLEEQYKKRGSSSWCSVDVIVPIYNAYDDLVNCLYSLLKHQDIYRIILIDDRSTDTRMPELFTILRRYDGPRFKVIENETNYGFVKTVNIGMKYSENDVILLNSDTIVTPNWVNKIKNCAYSDSYIATVTPLTNNGTICSIPKFLGNNEIPKGFTIDTFAQFLETISTKEYPEIPTAVGFCMFIKRPVIDKIGYFDEESFGLGYGEENDFCMRVIKSGYKNVLCDDTFVYHRGGSSFLALRESLTDEHLAILSKKHPDYVPLVESFIRSNPLSDIHNNISSKLRNILSIDEKIKILYILHDWGGGTEKHVRDLALHLSDIYVIYTLKPSNHQKNGFELEEYNNLLYKKYHYKCDFRGEVSIFKSQKYRSMLEKIVKEFNINIIHIHHLIGHTFDVLTVADQYKIPIAFTVHDYYSVCPRINLLDYNLDYCHHNNSQERCENCLSYLGLDREFILRWRSNFRELFNKSHLIIAPSESVFKILRTYYEIDESKLVIIEHGYDKHLIAYGEANRNIYDFRNLDNINIAYIGALGPHKGAEIFYELARSAFSKKINWFVIGISAKFSEPGYYPEYNVNVTGRYNDEQEMFRIIKENNIHLAIFPSPWPETFSYTLSECWIAGIPPIVSNLGALKERVEKTKGGWIVSSDAESFKKNIDEVLSEPDMYNSTKDIIANIEFNTLEDMAADYISIYDIISPLVHIKQK